MDWVSIYPELNGNIIDIVSSFDINDNEELAEKFNWKNTQPFLEYVHQQNGTKYGFLDYRLQYVKGYQYIKINEERYNEELHWWDV